MKKILLSSIALIGIAGTAVAADLPARMPVKAPPIMAPAFSWTGCYIGGYVGGAFADRRNGDYDVVATEIGSTATPRAAYNGPLDHSWGYDLDSSIIGGGTLGCNWQPLGSQFVLGIEGEAGYMSMKGSSLDYVTTNLPGRVDTYSNTAIGDWYGMITGRLGFAWDRVLLYGKGGVAFVNVDTSVIDACNTGACGLGLVNAVNGSNTTATWTAGGGIEWAFDMNWSVKAEYMFIALNNNNDDFRACGPGGGTAAGATYCWDHDIGGIHTAKVGINYRFGGGPVVARY